MLEIENCPKKD